MLAIDGSLYGNPNTSKVRTYPWTLAHRTSKGVIPRPCMTDAFMLEPYPKYHMGDVTLGSIVSGFFQGQTVWMVAPKDFSIQITFYSSRETVSMSMSDIPWMVIGRRSRHGGRNEWRPKWACGIARFFATSKGAAPSASWLLKRLIQSA